MFSWENRDGTTPIHDMSTVHLVRAARAVMNSLVPPELEIRIGSPMPHLSKMPEVDRKLLYNAMWDELLTRRDCTTECIIMLCTMLVIRPPYHLSLDDARQALMLQLVISNSSHCDWTSVRFSVQSRR